MADTALSRTTSLMEAETLPNGVPPDPARRAHHPSFEADSVFGQLQHLEAWEARLAEHWPAGPPPTDGQPGLLAKPGFWQRLQWSWARPASARACLEVPERRQAAARTAIDR